MKTLRMFLCQFLFESFLWCIVNQLRNELCESLIGKLTKLSFELDQWHHNRPKHIALRTYSIKCYNYICKKDLRDIFLRK